MNAGEVSNLLGDLESKKDITHDENRAILEWAYKRGYLAGTITPDMLLACLLSEKADTKGEVICDTSVRG